MAGETPRLLWQLNELDRVLDYLERMNLHDLTDVSSKVTARLKAAGLDDTQDLRPVMLIPKVLERQQVVRRQLAAIRRTGVT